jgi:UDP-glucuronate 4-epimerase
LGESRIIKLSDLVNTIERSLKKKAILNYLPVQAGDVARTYADISKAKSEIGYNPKFEFESGVRMFVKWYKESIEK